MSLQLQEHLPILLILLVVKFLWSAVAAAAEVEQIPTGVGVEAVAAEASSK
jgi:hypothetical protein